MHISESELPVIVSKADAFRLFVFIKRLNFNFRVFLPLIWMVARPLAVTCSPANVPLTKNFTVAPGIGASFASTTSTRINRSFNESAADFDGDIAVLTYDTVLGRVSIRTAHYALCRALARVVENTAEIVDWTDCYDLQKIVFSEIGNCKGCLGNSCPEIEVVLLLESCIKRGFALD